MAHHPLSTPVSPPLCNAHPNAALSVAGRPAVRPHICPRIRSWKPSRKPHHPLPSHMHHPQHLHHRVPNPLSNLHTRATRVHGTLVSTNLRFPLASGREFSFRARDVGNFLRMNVLHDVAADTDAARVPGRILVQNGSLHRTWPFFYPGLLSHDLGISIHPMPASELAIGRRASLRASRRTTAALSLSGAPKASTTAPRPVSPTANPVSRHVASMCDRFDRRPIVGTHIAETISIVASGTGTKRVRFQMHMTASHIYLSGSVPALGEWRPEYVCRRSQHCAFDGQWRGVWRLDVKIDDDLYKIDFMYIIVSESDSANSRVSTFLGNVQVLSSPEHLDRHAEGSLVIVKDEYRHESKTLTSPSPMRHNGIPFDTHVSALRDFRGGHHAQAPVRSADFINTPCGRARVAANHHDFMTPSRTLYGTSRDINGMFDNVIADPLSSDTYLSNKRTMVSLPSAATEESSTAHDDGSSSDKDEEPVGVDVMSSAVAVFNETTNDSHGHGAARRHEGPVGVDVMSSAVAVFNETTNDSHGHGAERRQSDQFSTQSVSSRSRPQTEECRSSMASPPSPEEVSPALSENIVDSVKKAWLTISGACRQSADDAVMASLRNCVDRLEAEADTLRVERDAFASDRDEAKGKLVVMRNERDANLAEVEAMRERQDTCTAGAKGVEKELQSLRDACATAEGLLGDTRMQRDAAEQESMKACRQAAQEKRDARAEEDRDALGLKLDTVLEEKALLEAEAAELRDAASQSKETCSKLSSTHQEMLDELASLRKEVDGKRAELEGQTAELRRLVEEKQVALDATVKGFEEERQVLQDRWAREFKECRKLHNTVQELRGNIRVFCRVRPLKNGTFGEREKSAVTFPDAQVGEHARIHVTGKLFEFDHVFHPETTQVEVYDETAGVVASVVDGYNVCIFAYGQTGSGKTYTMNGVDEDRGVNYRALKDLFDIADQRRDHFQVVLSVSMLEIYNESLRDLIRPGGDNKNAPKLEIRRDPNGMSHKAVHVPNLTEVDVTNFEETWDVIMQGTSNRSSGRTDMNEHSSRSHLLVRVAVRCEDLASGVKTCGILHMVDLAGSERVSRSNASGDRLKEAQHINKSLSSLGNVFTALTSNSSHIPYRNSRLTYLLQDSLGGDSKTLMFVNVSCDESDCFETTSSLQFAKRVSRVELGSAKRHTDRGAEVKATADGRGDKNRNEDPVRESSPKGASRLQRLPSAVGSGSGSTTTADNCVGNRVPRSQTAILRPPERLSMPTGNTSSTTSLRMAATPGIRQGMRSGLPRAGTVSSLRRPGGGGGTPSTSRNSAAAGRDNK